MSASHKNVEGGKSDLTFNSFFRSALSGAESPQRTEKSVGEYKVASGCPRCGGALFKYDDKGSRKGKWMRGSFLQCFSCGRIYRKLSEEVFRLWP